MSAAPESDVKQSGPISAKSISDAIAMLKEDPSIISTIASALSSNDSSEADKVDEAKPSHTSPAILGAHQGEFNLDKLPEIISVISPMLSGKQSQPHSKASDDNRTALLYALKPYLSSGRQEIIDSIIKISKVSEMIKRLK
jgi:hypothetical protein